MRGIPFLETLSIPEGVKGVVRGRATRADTSEHDNFDIIGC